jgi:hypothetical protein
MSDPTLQQPAENEALREYTVARQEIADLIRAAKQLGHNAVAEIWSNAIRRCWSN